MRDIYELAPHVMPWAPTCPEPVMIHYLRQAAITFCMRSRSWRSEETFKLISADQDISLVTCCDSVIHEIESARYREVPGTQWSHKLEPCRFDEVEDWEGETAPPRYYTQRMPNTLRVSPFSTGELIVSMFLKPDQRAQQLPDYLFETHAEIIAAGALAKLLLLPGYDFASPDLAMFYSGQFEQACDSHFRDNVRGQQRARTRTKASYL